MTTTTRAVSRTGGLTGTGGLTPLVWGTPAPSSRQRRPHRRWPWWLPLVALIPLLAGLGWWWSHPASLAETRLVGVREPGCVRLVIASDVSGSMAALTQPRDAAVSQLLAWAPNNLRGDDELALISFSDDAAVEIPPTPIERPISRAGAPAVSGGTELAPLLGAVSALPPTRCRTALLMLGDGIFGDFPPDETTATGQLASAGVDTFDLLVPGNTEIPAGWDSVYPSAPPEFFNGTDPDQTAMVFGRRLADLTGQELQRTAS